MGYAPLDDRTAKNASLSKHTSADDLPNELLLYIFTLLRLDSLITARRVNSRWHHLVVQAHICPLRAKLLRFYLSLVCSPAFRHSRSRTQLNSTRVVPHLDLTDEDREDYLQRITRNSSAPEEFKLWVREWPAYATRQAVSSDADDVASLELPSAWSPGSWCLQTAQGPYLKCVTFSGGRSPFDPGATLYATRILPVEFSGFLFPGAGGTFTDVDGADGEPTFEVTILCFGGGRALVLDGRRGGEELVGVVYVVRGSYSIRSENVLARSWVEYLEKDLKAAERSVQARLMKFRYDDDTGTLRSVAKIGWMYELIRLVD